MVPIGAQLIDATTGFAYTGSVSVFATLDTAAQLPVAGVITNEGNGLYTFTPAATERGGRWNAYTFIGAGAVPVTTVSNAPFMRRSAGQVCGAQVNRVDTGDAFGGLVTVFVTGDAGSEVLGTGTVTLKGHGYYTYEPTAAETDFGIIAYSFIGVGAIGAAIQVETVSPLVTEPPVSHLIKSAFIKLSVLGALDALAPEDAAFGLEELNRILDNWNAERQAVYCTQTTSFTLVPNLSPHTIGPTGSWVMTQRPVTIESLAWLSGQIFTDIEVYLDPLRYAALAQPSLPGIPTECFYEPAWPNGRLFFYPVPITAYQVDLLARVQLAGVQLMDNLSLPPGYQDALVLTLCESLMPSYPSAQVSPLLPLQAAKARARVFSNNRPPPRISTQDAGIPGRRLGGVFYDFRTGSWR
jgi:hypothetical protein